MSNYIIKKDNDSKEIIFMEYELDGYIFKPKTPVANVRVDQVTVINPSFKDKIITLKFNIQYQKILKLLYYILNSDESDDSDTKMALDEVTKLRDLMYNKYQAYLSNEKEIIMLQKLRDIENKLRYKNQFYYQEMAATVTPNPIHDEEEITSRKSM